MKRINLLCLLVLTSAILCLLSFHMPLMA